MHMMYPACRFQVRQHHEGVVLVAICLRSDGNPFVSPETCGACQHKTQESKTQETKRPERLPEPPSLRKQIVHYSAAVARWLVAGSPVRDDTEVSRVYAICSAPCKFFRQGSQVCRLCGCRLAPGGSGWKNKIRMGTERCPKMYW